MRKVVFLTIVIFIIEIDLSIASDPCPFTYDVFPECVQAKNVFSPKVNSTEAMLKAVRQRISYAVINRQPNAKQVNSDLRVGQQNSITYKVVKEINYELISRNFALLYWIDHGTKRVPFSQIDPEGEMPSMITLYPKY